MTRRVVDDAAGKSHGQRIPRYAARSKASNAVQIAAVNDFGVLDREHLLVSAPTSSGKTLIGELAALTSVHDGGRALFLLPTKALVNDKQREFETKYAAGGVRWVRATGDYSASEAPRTSI